MMRTLTTAEVAERLNLTRAGVIGRASMLDIAPARKGGRGTPTLWKAKDLRRFGGPKAILARRPPRGGRVGQ